MLPVQRNPGIVWLAAMQKAMPAVLKIVEVIVVLMVNSVVIVAVVQATE